MKKVLSFLITAMLVLSFALIASAAVPIKIIVGGNLLETDVEPMIVDGRTMLPVRAAFEAIGADVDFVAAERKVVATKEDTTVEFVIDSTTMKINGEAHTIDVPAMIVDDRTLVPVRACAESFDLPVEWNGNTRTVKIRQATSLPSKNNHGTIWEYDKNGNCIYWEDADGNYINYTYDENDNLVYQKENNDYFVSYSYDNYGNEIFREDSTGYFAKSTYDENGNLIYWENSNNEWKKYDYDQNNNPSRTEYSTGYWAKYIYDKNGKCHYQESSQGLHVENTFDAQGRLIQSIDSSFGLDFSFTYTYDEYGNLLLREDPEGNWTKYTYDEYGNEIFYERSDGMWKKYIYDENGKIILQEDSFGYLVTYTYDTYGNVIYWENNNGYSETYTYDKNNNLIKQESSEGSWTEYIVLEI